MLAEDDHNGRIMCCLHDDSRIICIFCINTATAFTELYLADSCLLAHALQL